MRDPPQDDEREVDLARARLAAIVESSDDVIVSKTLDGVITSWNTAAERLFGWTAAEAVGQHITLIVPPERRAEEDEVLARIRRGERVDHFETVRVAKDGRLTAMSITVSPIKDSAGRIVGASKVARDLTNRQQGEFARGRLAAIVESSDDVIVSKTLDGVITTWNGAAERLFGWTAAEAIGQHIWERPRSPATSPTAGVWGRSGPSCSHSSSKLERRRRPSTAPRMSCWPPCRTSCAPR